MVKKHSIIWPLTLIGFPVAIALFLISGAMYEEENYGYWLTLYSRILIFSLMLLLVFNVVFGLYSSATVLSKRSILLGALGFISTILSIGLASYFFTKLWRANGVNMFSFKDKSHSDVFAWFFYILMVVVVSFSFFVTGVDFKV
ncbi:hypothetical protein [Rheinheimera hassiensis]|uniref:hypothetical protein n=1 Tax=Rheinheimera hassiensis TaxID=1193627 RepID=UPI001F05604D|nr:hypothetical protein [Rheinheimera hassiensis]